MSKKFFVCHHLGMGDHFVMNGFIHFLLVSGTAEEILLVVKEHNLPSVQKMYQGFDKVKFFPIKSLADIHPPEDGGLVINKYIEQGYGYLGFGVHSGNTKYLELDTSWANCFYKQHGVDPTFRWKFFKFPENLDKSVELVKKVVEKVGHNYVVIHDDPSRGFKIKYNAVKRFLKEDGLENYPIVYLGKNRYASPLIEGSNSPDLSKELETETLYDYCHLLANAISCHMMDSSIALLLDYLPVRQDQKRYMHEYAKVGEILSTEGLFQKEWLTLTDAHV